MGGATFPVGGRAAERHFVAALCDGSRTLAAVTDVASYDNRCQYDTRLLGRILSDGWCVGRVCSEAWVHGQLFFIRTRLIKLHDVHPHPDQSAY